MECSADYVSMAFVNSKQCQHNILKTIESIFVGCRICVQFSVSITRKNREEQCTEPWTASDFRCLLAVQCALRTHLFTFP